ncbi:MAG TPA: 6-bladed beta-propeller [Gammaproteobacteria bacterium]
MNQLVDKWGPAKASNGWCAAVLLLPLLLLAGCATTPEQRAPMRFHHEKEIVTWPSLPEVPRYAFVGELIGEVNFLPENHQQERSWLEIITGLFSSKVKRKELQRPQGGVVDALGRICVTDVGRNAVMVFDPVNKQFHLWEWAGQNQRFLAPIGITAGPDNSLLVADAELKVVVRLSRDGEPLGQFGHGLLLRPTGIARDATRGRIYVADTHGHDIKVFDDNGELLDTLGQRGEKVGEFNFPTHIAFVNDNLYVTDSRNSRIQVLDADGMTKTSFGERGLFVGNLPHPKGVSSDSDGNIYVVESYYDHLLIYNAQGELLLPIGGTGQGIGQFYLPAGVWNDNNNRLYVADMFNGRVVVLQYLGGE